MIEIIQGDAIKVLPTLPKAKMIFADPPDNLGVEYDGFEDRWPSDADYICWLGQVAAKAANHCDVFWLSYYWKWDVPLKSELGWIEDWFTNHDIKPYVWWYAFGQHQQKDNASCFRPMLRFSEHGTKWNTDAIREPSDRQRIYGDKRADPRGKVPGDVWDGVWEESRVCGTFKEKRKWHKNQHPEALLERMILMCTQPGDLVIDMFGGTFTTARVCKRLGRDCISIEISKNYCKHGRSELGVTPPVPEAT